MPTVASYIATRAAVYVGDARLPELQIEAGEETGPVFTACGKREKAIFLLIMHWIELDDDRGGVKGSGAIGGMVKKVKEGMLEKEFLQDFSLSKEHPDLSQTRWGLELLRLRKSCIVGPRNRHTKPT